MKKTYYKYNILHQIPFTEVSVTDKFWRERIEINHNISLPLQYEELKKSGVIDNFKKAINRERNNHIGLFFSDSDAYKWIEAVCHSSAIHSDSILKKSLDDILSLIINAQEPDGYINTYFQIMEPDKKFTNFGVCHELYTGGHLISAGIAHYKTFGESSMLRVSCRFADLICNVFGEGKLEAFDGHAGIEIALIDLYRFTAELKYLKLSEFFINQHGKLNSRLRWELNHLDEIGGDSGKPGRNNIKKYVSYEKYDGRYAQDHLPVREQTEAVGHAVRAMYLYCGMADLFSEIGDAALLSAMEKIWNNIVSKKMYITGGIGSSIFNEGFSEDYDLPDENACAETCSAIGFAMWSLRMLNITGKGMYADIIELILYNSFLAGVSIDGKKYFYNNPSKSKGDQHRETWYKCACCPPNVARLIATIGGFIYSSYDEGIVINQYIQSSVHIELSNKTKITLNMESAFPWNGRTKIFFYMDESSDFSVSLRIPDWCKKFTVKINNKKLNYSLDDGYLKIKRIWNNNDFINLVIEMNVMFVKAHPLVLHNRSKIAIKRGPLVYCLEENDHDTPVDQISIPNDSELNIIFMPDLLGGVNVIECKGLLPEIKVRAIPYYSWSNRDTGAMVVWIESIN